jgi:hypothetical protein
VNVTLNYKVNNKKIMSIDIFSEAKEKAMPQWMKFVNPGDSVQGTYVGKIIGQFDGYGNEQIIYQILQDDGSIMNVGFGLNKKFINNDMATVKFGQIIGFKYKGKVLVKDKFGKQVEVKDYSLHQDPKIVNAVWLKENIDNMPEVTVSEQSAAEAQANKDFEAITTEVKTQDSEDVPFSSPGSLTNEDKLAVIMKLAKDKLGATDLQSVKDKVMGATGIAFIPLQYDKITETLSAM